MAITDFESRHLYSTAYTPASKPNFNFRDAAKCANCNYGSSNYLGGTSEGSYHDHALGRLGTLKLILAILTLLGGAVLAISLNITMAPDSQDTYTVNDDQDFKSRILPVFVPDSKSEAKKFGLFLDSFGYCLDDNSLEQIQRSGKNEFKVVGLTAKECKTKNESQMFVMNMKGEFRKKNMEANICAEARMDKCDDKGQCPIELRKCHGHEREQHWSYTLVDGIFSFKNEGGNVCLTSHGKGPLVVENCTKAANQKFMLI